MKRGGPLKRTGRLKPMSAKTKARIPERTLVREEALRLAGNQCQAKDVIPEISCWHPPGKTLDVDEIRGRGVNPGGQFDPDNVQVLCRAHHAWKTDHPKEAHERGLTKFSWEH